MSSKLVAYGEAPLPLTAKDVEPAGHVEPEGDRGKDWPLAAVLFAPVLVAYAGAGFGAYAIVNALL